MKLKEAITWLGDDTGIRPSGERHGTHLRLVKQNIYWYDPIGHGFYNIWVFTPTKEQLAEDGWEVVFDLKKWCVETNGQTYQKRR